MSLIKIKKGDPTQVAPHFTAGEFFSKQPGRHAITEHDFHTECIEAVAYLRAHYGVPWRITSTYRPDSAGSQHRECRAVDSQDTKSGAAGGSPIIKDLVAQLLDSTSEVFVQLRRLGITGFGVYDSFVHLDCRDTTKFPAQHKDRFGSFAFWDNRTDKSADQPKKKATTIAPPVKKLSPKPAPAPASTVSSGKSSQPVS